jgi:hypothetical protein
MLLCSAGIASAATFPRVNGYRSDSDSPAVAAGLASILVVDRFEIPANSLGLSVSSGVPTVGNSVDFDDNSLDGVGATGKSLALGAWFPFEPSNATMNFDAGVLGAAPRFAGLVVTNASGVDNPDGSPAQIPVTLTVYLTDGSSIQQVFDILSAENNSLDDVFIGVDLGADALVGVDSINVSAATPIQIDHVQYTGVAAFASQFVKDDHNGDGRSDVAWFYEPGRKSAVWNVNLGAVSGGYTSIDPGSAGITVGAKNAFTLSITDNDTAGGTAPIAEFGTLPAIDDAFASGTKYDFEVVYTAKAGGALIARSAVGQGSVFSILLPVRFPG